VDGAVDEFRLPDLARCPDVALLAAGEPVAFVEVFQTHKAGDLPALAWIEVEAESIIRDPVRWVPLRDHFRPWTCGECKREAAADRARAERAARERVRKLHRLARRQERADEEVQRFRGFVEEEVLSLRLAIERLPYRLEEFPSYRPTRILRCTNGHELVALAWRGSTRLDSDPPRPAPPVELLARTYWARIPGGGDGIFREWTPRCPCGGEAVRDVDRWYTDNGRRPAEPLLCSPVEVRRRYQMFTRLVDRVFVPLRDREPIEVSVFELDESGACVGHVFGWAYRSRSGPVRFVTVLASATIGSPQTAVEHALGADLARGAAL
jgi:hypothetical protein